MHDLSKLRGTLKAIGGSMSDDWNNILANQTIRTLWLKNSQAEDIRRQRHAAVDVLIGINPADELEGMIAAQLLAAHNASMECYRRARLAEQTFEGRREALSQANKLSRTYATLLEALNRHRGKGQGRGTADRQDSTGRLPTQTLRLPKNEFSRPFCRRRHQPRTQGEKPRIRAMGQSVIGTRIRACWWQVPARGVTAAGRGAGHGDALPPWRAL